MEKDEYNNPANKSLIANIKEYINIQVDLLKINLVEKLSQIISLLIGLIVGSLLALVIIVYLSVTLVYWLGTIFNSLLPGLLIISGVFVLLFVLFYINRNKLFLNAIVRMINKILFEKEQSSKKE